MLANWPVQKWIGTLTVSAALVAGAYTFPYRVTVIVGQSMEPTYRNLSFALTRKMPTPPLRGDVVVVRRGNETYVKRVALVPGDRIWQSKQGAGQWTDLLGYDPKKTPHSSVSRFRIVTIPKGKIYLLGDNPIASIDSRDLGTFDIKDIVGVLQYPRRNGPSVVRSMSVGLR